ncbi:hypothetical protein BDW02DRAFT_567552 [Decorospora gaudefroyi]|uniref:Tubby C-terminal-like domain-containing protein n=1 Tax=Decorospora gaudefroyi TaxID=184978 RepID=A0A6A5KFT0_9PLEO|nr:hypothetical protein BDW02DRAFT_567552 [Decorospora gaudefroyi]
MAPNLPPLPVPGLSLIPNFTAQRPEIFVLKAQDRHLGRASMLISACDPKGHAGAPFMQLNEESSHNVVFRTMEGQEVMRIMVDRHSWFSHKTEYKAVRSADAVPIWDLELKTGWRVPKYDLTIRDKSLKGKHVQVESKVAGEEKGIVIDGSPASTVSRHQKWSHKHNEYVVHVAPGMDIMLALGVGWIRADKVKKDEEVAVVA